MLIILCTTDYEAGLITKEYNLFESSRLPGVKSYSGNSGVEVFLVVAGNRQAIQESLKAVFELHALEFDGGFPLLLNFGVLERDDNFTESVIILPHTITAREERKKFYQELIYNHSFEEHELEEVEAYEFFKNAVNKVATSQIIALRVVKGDEAQMNECLKMVRQFTSDVLSFLRQKPALTAQTVALLHQLAKNLRLTRYQEIELRKLAGGHAARRASDEVPMLRDYLDRAPKTKDQVKEIFSEIRRALAA